MRYYADKLTNKKYFDEFKNNLPRAWKPRVNDLMSFYQLFESWCDDTIEFGGKWTDKEIHNVLGNYVTLCAFKQSLDGHIKLFFDYHFENYNEEYEGYLNVRQGKTRWIDIE